MSKKGFYAVQSGRNPGVYSTWAEAKAQVDGYSGAVFKKFDSTSNASSFANSNSGYSNSNSNSNSYSNSYSNSNSGGASSSRNYSQGSSSGSSNSYSNNPTTSSSYSSSGYSNNPSSYSSYSSNSYSRNSSNSYSGTGFGSASSYTTPAYSNISTTSISPSYTSTADYSTSASSGQTPKKTHYYAVANGRETGVFKDWDSTKKQVDGFSGAKYKKFDSAADAQSYVKSRVIPPEDYSVGQKRSYPSATHGQTTTSKVNKNYYAVNFGNGLSKVYNDWDSCKRAVSGKQNVTYKKFNNLDQANVFTNQETVTESEIKDRTRRTEQYLAINSKQVLKEQQSLPKSIIYTDGSYLPVRSGKYSAGIGVYYGPDDPRNVSEKLHESVDDSYVPEVRALDQALKNVASEIDKYEKGEGNIFPKYTISSDNEATKNVLTKYSKTWNRADFLKRKEGETLFNMSQNYNKIQKFYNQNAEIFDGHKFEIEWVKGHAGIEGNEAADILAKNGARLRTRPT